MAYKDKNRQREADRLRQKRHRERLKSQVMSRPTDTSTEGVTSQPYQWAFIHGVWMKF